MQSMLEAITQDTVPQNPDFVRVMSLHKSKGLTGQSVYVVGAVQGVLPTIVSDDPAGREAATNEGRRLFYVAVTRSADELVISSSALIDLADANARLVAYDRGTIRRAGDHYTVRSLPCQYLRELGRSAPRSQPGAAWLRSR
jgi:superfamily I DNA/RNA helicase